MITSEVDVARFSRTDANWEMKSGYEDLGGR